MAWATPQFSRGDVDAAGRKLQAGPQDDILGYIRALDVINNWRSSHSFPLNTFQVTLRAKGRKVDGECLVAQRIKRLSSINHKLDRFPKMRLSQIQDIGGCRAVVGTIDQVRDVVNVYRRSDLKHKLVTVDDYLAHPQRSGYRGIHLIYRYFSDKKTTAYNDLKIEMQVRSQFQHAWATAVETVGTFIRQALKSSLGEAEWLRFFALMGSVIALQEGTAPVADTPTDPGELIRELRAAAQSLDVSHKLEAYGSALQTFGDYQQGGSHYFLLQLNAKDQEVRITAYERAQLAAAQKDYLEAEKAIAENPDVEVVLVSVDSVAALTRAYPNYFLDTRVFIGLMQNALQGDPLTIPVIGSVGAGRAS